MAFFLTPRFAPATQQCGPFSCAPARPSQHRVSRQPFPSFVPFLSQVDELITELDREARRAAHQQRQQRKRAFRARFDVNENKDGYQVDGEVPGFEQENISIEVTDEYTLKVAGNTEQKTEKPTTTETEMDGVTITETEVAGTGAATPTGSDAGSHKSYNATVEDDFEDLGAETSSTISGTSEPKGKEKAVEEGSVQKSEIEAPAPRSETQDREWLSERVHGSFERTFQFPARIDASNVRANLKNGVLSITVPKAPVPEVRQITIQ